MVADPWIGRVLRGKYEIQGFVGTGACGAVYKAIHRGADLPVAVKILHESKALDEGMEERLLREALIIGSLQHPNTVRLFDRGRSRNGELFLVMELLHGRSLKQVVQDDAPLASHRVAGFMAEACKALEEAACGGDALIAPSMLPISYLPPETAIRVASRGDRTRDAAAGSAARCGRSAPRGPGGTEREPVDSGTLPQARRHAPDARLREVPGTASGGIERSPWLRA